MSLVKRKRRQLSHLVAKLAIEQGVETRKALAAQLAKVERRRDRLAAENERLERDHRIETEDVLRTKDLMDEKLIAAEARLQALENGWREHVEWLRAQELHWFKRKESESLTSPLRGRCQSSTLAFRAAADHAEQQLEQTSGSTYQVGLQRFGPFTSPPNSEKPDG